VTPVSISRRPSATASTHSHVVPEGAISEKSGDPSQRPVVQIANNPLEIHMAALQTFLTTHLENIRVLQNSVPPIVDGRRAAGKADQANKATRALGGQEEEVYATLAQQFHMRVVIVSVARIFETWITVFKYFVLHSISVDIYGCIDCAVTCPGGWDHRSPSQNGIQRRHAVFLYGSLDSFRQHLPRWSRRHAHRHHNQRTEPRHRIT